ncbi:MAG: FHIPEP family type III secretion protein [Pseudomonas sp.]
MDGASKFVRGDAVAGMLILFINLIGGVAIGMIQHGMSIRRRLQGLHVADYR